jgi:hypothetical protein
MGQLPEGPRAVVGRPSSLPVILEKGQPSFTRVASASNFTQIAGDSPLRGNESGLQQLAIELGDAPVPILLRQTSDQPPDLIGDPRSAASSAGSPSPVQPEAGTVPTDGSLGLHDNQNVTPA